MMFKKQLYTALFFLSLSSGATFVMANDDVSDIVALDEDEGIDALTTAGDNTKIDEKVPFAQKLVRPFVGPLFTMYAACQSCAQSVKARVVACYKAMKKRCCSKKKRCSLCRCRYK